MSQERQEYKGHRIELRAPASDKSVAREIETEAETEAELLIDDQPLQYGRLPNGQYFLREYAYDWRDDLMDLARGLIDYRETASESRPVSDELREREVEPEEGE